MKPVKGNARFSDQQVRDIRTSTLPAREMAHIQGCGYRTILDIRAGKTYGWVAGTVQTQPTQFREEVPVPATSLARVQALLVKPDEPAPTNPARDLANKWLSGEATSHEIVAEYERVNRELDEWI